MPRLSVAALITTLNVIQSINSLTRISIRITRRDKRKSDSDPIQGTHADFTPNPARSTLSNCYTGGGLRSGVLRWCQ